MRGKIARYGLRRRVWRVTCQCNRKGRLLVTQSSWIPRFTSYSREGGGGVRIRHNFGAAEHAVVNIAWNAAGIYSAIGKLGQSRWNNFSTTGRCIAIVPLIKLSYILFELNIFSLREVGLSHASSLMENTVQWNNSFPREEIRTKRKMREQIKK